MLVVLADHLTLADVTRPGLPNLARLRAEGQMALMSPGLAQGTDPVANVYATLGAGDSIRVGDISQGRLSQALTQAHVRTALIGDADGDDTELYRPAALILPAPTMSFIGKSDGTVADPLAPGGKRVDPARLWALTQTALRDCDFVLVQDGDFARAERENRRGDLLPLAYRLHRQSALSALDAYLGLVLPACEHSRRPPRRLMLVTPTPPLTGQGTWDSLTPFLQLPPPPWGATKVRLLARSDTTQTVGLVSARDLAPTILQAVGSAPPVQMTGAVIGDAPVLANTGALARLLRLDRQTRLNQQAQNPLFWGLGFGAAALLFSGLGCYLMGALSRSHGLRRASLYGLRLLAAWPLALLLAPLAHPATLGAYFAAIAGLTAAVALLPSPPVIYALTACVLVVDGFSGTALVSQSVLSVYALSGIRFYGIGNEYMGILLAGALLAASNSVRLPLALWFALVTFVLSFPAFGAKAGGAVTAVSTFVVAWRRLRGRRVTWKHGAAGLAAGFGLVFLWALVGHWLPVRHTHIDAAVDAMAGGRLGYIAGVTWRKVGLALRVTLHPGTLLGLLGLVLLAGAARLFLRRPVAQYLSRHPRFAAIWGAGLWGCVVAVLFNDSGIVAAILLLTSLGVALLHGLYQECALSPSTSETSASESPSATP